MSLSRMICLVLLASTLGLTACGEKDADVREAARESLPQRAPQDMLQTATTPTATGTVFHYTCPNGCEGGGADAQGVCPVCNTSLVHNQAYHNQPVNVDNNPVTPDISDAVNDAGQNAAGVFHYICPDGHEGGAASAGSCATCGKALVHNQAYHNQPANTGNANQSQTIDMSQLTPPQPAANSNSDQNAAGVYHYTCPNGCAGGAGSAVACASCGTTLVHNQAYHN